MTSGELPESMPADVEQYFDLQAKRDELTEDAQAASFSSDLYAVAIESATARINELEGTVAVQDYLRNLAQPLLDKMSQQDAELDKLAAKAAGLIPEEEIEARRGALRRSLELDIHADSRLAAALGFLARQSTQQSTTALAKPVVPAPSQSTSEQGRPPLPSVTIVQRGDAVLIGKHGKGVRLSGRASQGHRDYTEERVAILKALVEHQGEMLTPQEIWQHSFPGKDFVGETFTQLRFWLNQLTYRRQPIVLHNGKRGFGSRHGIVQFDVQFRQESVVRMTPTVRTAKETMPASANDTQQPEKEISQDRGPFPLNVYESAILAAFINIHKPTLSKLNIQPIGEEIAEMLSELASESERAAAIKTYGTITGVRQAALKAVVEFFGDDDKVLEALGRTPDNDPRLGLFSYLIDIEGEERWGLLRDLLETSGLRYEALVRRRGTTILPDTIRRSVVLPDRGDIFSTERPQPSYSAIDPEPPVDYAPALPAAPDEVHDPIDIEATSPEAALTAPQPEASPEEPAPAEPTGGPAAESVDETKATHKGKSPREWERNLRRSVGEAIQRLEEWNLMSKEGVSLRHASYVSESAKFGTKTALERLVAANILSSMPSNEMDFVMTPELRVFMYIFNTHQNDLKIRSRLRKAEVIVREALNAYYKKHEQ